MHHPTDRITHTITTNDDNIFIPGEGVEHALHVLAEKLVELYDKSSKSAAETRSWLTDTSQSNSSSKQTSMCCS